MNIDTSMVINYLNGGTDYEKHWIFNSIAEGEYLFESPLPEKKQEIKEGLEKAVNDFNSFCPYNVELFSELFPAWRELSGKVNIILSVGCPAPYDAMVREHNGEEFIIFDLVRLLSYQEEISALTMPLLTHEITHICIHADYPYNFDKNYYKSLEYITFDEGFAHLLSFTDSIDKYDFKPIIDKYYRRAVHKLKLALAETDVEKQKEYMDEVNCGAYWEKFAAISGKLYLASNADRLKYIYKEGSEKMMRNLLEEMEL